MRIETRQDYGFTFVTWERVPPATWPRTFTVEIERQVIDWLTERGERYNLFPQLTPGRRALAFEDPDNALQFLLTFGDLFAE